MVCINKKYYFDDSISALSEQAVYWKESSDRWEYDAHSFYDDIVCMQEFIHRTDIDKEDIRDFIDGYIDNLNN